MMTLLMFRLSSCSIRCILGKPTACSMLVCTVLASHHVPDSINVELMRLLLAPLCHFKHKQQLLTDSICIAHVQAGMQYGLMHKLPGKSLHQLHQLSVPAASLQHQTYQLHLDAHYPTPATQHVHSHSQSSGAHQGLANAHSHQGLANAHSGHAQSLQGLRHPATHAQQQMHLQQHPGHVQHYAAGQYQPAAVQEQHEEQQGAYSGQQAAAQGSVEPGDDWIEQVTPAALLLLVLP